MIIRVIHFIAISLLLHGCVATMPAVKEPPPVVASYYPCSYDVFWWAVCMAESGCSNTSVYKEPAPLNYESIGLYQLSPEDHRGYPECSPNRADYFIAEKNTECKNAIEKKLRSKYPTLSYQLALGKYWSVLRGPEWGDKQRTGFARFKSYAAKKGCVF
jgi:hypothetical protein